MKRLILFVCMGGLSLVAPAQTTPDDAVRIHAYQIALPAVAYRIHPSDFDEYKRAYDLSNGDVLVMRQIGVRMYARLGDGPQRELVAAAPNVFVARDRQLKITLNRDNFGDFKGEVLMVVPSNATAQADAGTQIRLVSLR
jgi:hypothetical protein